MAVVISCATDDELAKNLYDHLGSQLPFSAGGSKRDISLEGDEIVVDSSVAGRDDILRIISAFIKSEPERYGAYRITEFDGVLIVGIPAGDAQMLEDLKRCDMCNYMTLYEEQLYLHKMTHGNVVIG